MPNVTGPGSVKYRGWFSDMANNLLEAFHGTTRVFGASASALTVDLATTFSSTVSAVSGALTVASLAMAGAGRLSLGTPEAVVIASGVATVTRPIVALTGEGATTDTLDSITYTGAVAGDILILTVGALGYTITADNSATMLLGAGTRALVANSTLVLRYAGTTWIEVAFLTATS